MKVYILINEYVSSAQPIPATADVYKTKQEAITEMKQRINEDKEESWFSFADIDDIFFTKGEIQQDVCESYIQEEDYDDEGDLVGWCFYENGNYNDNKDEYRIVEKELKN